MLYLPIFKSFFLLHLHLDSLVKTFSFTHSQLLYFSGCRELPLQFERICKIDHHLTKNGLTEDIKCQLMQRRKEGETCEELEGLG